MYNLKFTTKAQRYFKKLEKKDKQLLLKMSKAIEDIRLYPYEAGESKKGDLAGLYSYDVYHQGSNYEIAYKVEEDEEGNMVLILLAGRRENFYEQLRRYMK